MVELFSDWVVLVDGYQFSLAKKYTNKKTGEVSYVAKFYYNSLSEALKKFRRIIVMERLKDAEITLTEAVKVISDSNKEVEEFIDKSVGVLE